jgi:hypothetical protein
MPYQSQDINRIDQRLRRQEHQKQGRTSIGAGVPSLKDMREGVPVIRSTQEGMVEFIRVGNALYKNRLERVLEKGSTDILYFADDGYVKFGNGLILQWGQETSADTTEAVTFPVAFPIACLNVVATPYESGSASADDGAVAVSVLPTTTGVTFNSTADWGTIFWQAIGH